MKPALLTAALLTSLAFAGEPEMIEVTGSVVPINEEIDFALHSIPGCKTKLRNTQHDTSLFKGVIVGTGEGMEFGPPTVGGCWERLPDQQIRTYIEALKPEYQILTFPPEAEKIKRMWSPKKEQGHRLDGKPRPA
jgi:hypothetical protein